MTEHALVAGGSRLPTGGWSCTGCPWKFSYAVPEWCARDVWERDPRHRADHRDTEPARWDIGDPEPEGVMHVHDLIADAESDGGGHWGRTTGGDWKGYKDGGKVYLGWAELVRRWGPVEERGPGCGR